MINNCLNLPFTGGNEQPVSFIHTIDNLAILSGNLKCDYLRIINASTNSISGYINIISGLIISQFNNNFSKPEADQLYYSLNNPSGFVNIEKFLALSGLLELTGNNLSSKINNTTGVISGISLNGNIGNLTLRNFNGPFTSNGQNIWAGIISTGGAFMTNNVTMAVPNNQYALFSGFLSSGIWQVEGQIMVRSTANAALRVAAIVVDVNANPVKTYCYNESTIAALGANITGIATLDFGPFFIDTPSGNLVVSGTSSLANSVVLSSSHGTLTGFKGVISPGTISYLNYSRIA